MAHRFAGVREREQRVPMHAQEDLRPHHSENCGAHKSGSWCPAAKRGELPHIARNESGTQNQYDRRKSDRNPSRLRSTKRLSTEKKPRSVRIMVTHGRARNIATRQPCQRAASRDRYLRNRDSNLRRSLRSHQHSTARKRAQALGSRNLGEFEVRR